jgi:23S rRNA (cytidine2498-2'-O)-methyltransferase
MASGAPPVRHVARATPVLIAHCRAGFEPEAAADLAHLAALAGTSVAVDAAPGRAFVVAPPAAFEPRRWTKALASAAPIFVRSLFVGGAAQPLFDPAATRGRPDRVAPLAALIEALHADPPLRDAPTATPFAALRLETPDTNDGKELSGLCRALQAPLVEALQARGVLAPAGHDSERGAGACAHVLFVDGAHVHVGVSLAPWGSPWPMGIPRLSMPRAAPSRSTLKLAEAFVVFLGERAPHLLRAGMKAVDLGAAPGGWTWQLAERGLRVTAIDNGALKGEVAQDPLVTHLRVDGLTWRPPRPVDWMVCDVVAQPARIAALVGRWLAEGHARRIVFNLKLPMKKRYDEVERCTAIIVEAAAKRGVRCTLRLRQLFHDREEVTGYAERIG